MEKTSLQNKLDIQKWLESENQQRDLCGEYEYCAYCEPSEEYPCAAAYEKCNELKAQNATPAAAHVAPVKIAAKPAAKKTTAKPAATKSAAAKPAAAKTASAKPVAKSATAKPAAAKTAASEAAAAKEPAKKTAKK